MSHVLVDTPIWIDFFRDADLPTSETLDRLLQLRLVCTTDLLKAIPDVLVATVALEHQKLLYSKDHHFRLIARHLPLRLFQGL